jgi:hypothetical protein
MQLMVGALSHRSAHAVLVSLLVHLAVWGPSMCPQAHSLSPCLRFSPPVANALLSTERGPHRALRVVLEVRITLATPTLQSHVTCAHLLICARWPGSPVTRRMSLPPPTAAEWEEDRRQQLKKWCGPSVYRLSIALSGRREFKPFTARTHLRQATNVLKTLHRVTPPRSA